MESVYGLSVDKHIKSTSDLREIADLPSHFVTDKIIDHMDDLNSGCHSAW